MLLEPIALFESGFPVQSRHHRHHAHVPLAWAPISQSSRTGGQRVSERGRILGPIGLSAKGITGKRSALIPTPFR